ncbi:MAG TPA: phosphoenolpyruvate carboxylase [Thermoanaerobaculia bacterium]|nr:phosphoenolpyruvate carboxylase [Thermoanaerobaculia bacterium]
MASSSSASDRRLRDDVRLLGELLGETLRSQEGNDLFDLVEQVRALAKSGRAGKKEDFERLAELLASRPTTESLPVARAFAHFLNLANIAEQHHRVRRRRDYEMEEGAAPQPGSCDEVFARMIAKGVSPDQLYETVTSMQIELVITAHPTEVVRRTFLQKYKRIADLLARGDHVDLTVRERREVVDDLRREITAAWETDEVRHDRPTPLDEVKGGLFIFEQTLWEALPQYLRAVDESLRAHTGRPLPPDCTPLRFGSWIGGDRDGNPNVTPDVTGQAGLLSRWMAADLFHEEIDALRSELSMREGSAELQRRSGGAREPYRAVLKDVRDRLAETRTSIETALVDDGGWRGWRSPFATSADLLEPLLACHRSLHETGNGLIADGRLVDVIRRAYTFGLVLVRLDIRQDAARHTSLLGAITRLLSAGDYGEWDEKRRQQFLLRELASPRPLIPPDARFDEEDQDVIDTFRAIAAIPAESLGAYVITMASRPSDVLAVALLQREAGVARPLRIVPLFETITDLRSAADSMRGLLSIDWYRSSIDGRQEVMVGYSDSAKDAGRLAAAWELYKAQEEIVDAVRGAGVELTLFHGRGGSVGRGGGPTYLAIRSQPPGTVDGRLRVTVQGEMIQAEFGLAGIALRTLEIYTTATVDATLAPADPPKQEWREAIDAMALAAARAYRSIVYETPEFLDYFRTATPEVELGELNIGSRPARRGGGKRGVESLRAIPWQFAWTQNRLLLPSWLGTSDALGAVDEGIVAEMMSEWPFFRSLIELTEMVLAKAEPPIAEHYERALAPPALRPIGQHLRERLARTTALIRRVTGHERLLETNSVLRRSIDVRNPYVDPINLIQVEILRRYRAHPDPTLRDAFVVTVNGIAAGMRNTG